MASPRLCLWRFSSWRLAITLVSLVARGCHAELRASKRYAWALHFYDDAYAQQGLTAVASLVLTRTRADIVVFGLGLSNATHSALTVMGPKIRVVRKAREQAVACPHKVIRSSSQPTSATQAAYANVHLDCSKLPWSLELQEYDVVGYLDSDFLFVSNPDSLLTSAAHHLKPWTLNAPNPAVIVAANPSGRDLAEHYTRKGVLLKRLPPDPVFQAGLMVFRPDQHLRTAFVRMIESRRADHRLSAVRSNRGDQLITRDFFSQRVAWANPRFNVPVNRLWEESSACQERLLWIAAERVVGLHFSAASKPWFSDAQIRAVMRPSPRNCTQLFFRYVCAWREIRDARVDAAAGGVPLTERRISSVLQPCGVLHAADANTGHTLSREHQSISMPEQCGANDTRVDTSHLDWVIVSLRGLCITKLALRRLLFLFNPRRIFYITGRPADCKWIDAIDTRVVCIDEAAYYPAMQLDKLHVACASAACFSPSNCSDPQNRLRPFGWYLQQFIKLGVSRYIADLSLRYVLWDADNVPLFGRELFSHDGRVILRGNPRSAPYGYDEVYHTLLGERVPPPPPNIINWVVGYMVIDVRVAQAMLARMESRMHAPWPRCVCKALISEATAPPQTEKRWFSEYQTYASWLISHQPHGFAPEHTTALAYPRNPAPWLRGARRGKCCIKEHELCALSTGNREHFYVVLEEHKYRYRDCMCQDWQQQHYPADGCRPSSPPSLPLA